MNKPVDDISELMPIVEKAVKSLYDQSVENIKIVKTTQVPFFKEPKLGWLVHAEFNDDNHEYAVQIDIQMADGQITRAFELHRTLLQK